MRTGAVPSSPVLVENFDNNKFNPNLWHTVQIGTGPAVTVANNRLEITIPPNSTNDSFQAIFGAGLTSACIVHGDFDLQVGFTLLTWPSASGVRTGLGSSFLLGGTGPSASTTPFAVERDSFGNPSVDFPNQPREVYLTHLIDGVQGIVPTSAQSGQLRLVRSGATATGYYLNSSTWIVIHNGPVDPGDLGFGFAAWSHN